jgi:hypothetical protein
VKRFIPMKFQSAILTQGAITEAIFTAKSGFCGIAPKAHFPKATTALQLYVEV